MKRTALAFTLISALFFLLVGVQFIGLAEANPYLYRMGFKDIDPLPGTIPPKIISLNLRNHTTYSSRDLNVTISATRPVTSYPAKFGPLYVYYFLDGLHQNYMFYTFPSSEVDSSTVLNNLRSGSHKLVVQVICYVEPGGMSAVFRVDSNSTVYFTVEDTHSSPSPSSSSLSTPIPETTPTPPNMGPTSPPSQEPLLTQEQAVIVGVAVASIVVFLGLLVIFIRRK